MKPRSIRRRLITILLILGVSIWIIAVVATSYYFQHLILRQADTFLEHYSSLTQHILRIVRYRFDDISTERLRLARQGSRTGEELRVKNYREDSGAPGVNFWYTNSSVVVGSDTPRFPDPERTGYITHQIESESGITTWRILYTHSPREGYWIGVGVDLANLDYIGVITVWRMLLPMIVVLPVMLIILLIGVRSGLRPLNALAKSISQRKPNLLRPVNNTDTPKELLPVVEALNDLLADLRRALEHEKRFTANAAHELQTPLAAIQAEIQRLQHSPESDALKPTLQNLFERVNRASRMVKQLLQLARLDPAGDHACQTVNLTKLLKEEIADLGAIASERKLHISLEGLDEQHAVTGNAEQLRILVRNLVLNAFKHTLDQGNFLASIESVGTSTLLVIANDCDPIPPDDYPLLGTRFYRGAAVDVSGSGLGLSIVHRIAELHHASVNTSPWNAGSGFRIEILFPG